MPFFLSSWQRLKPTFVRCLGEQRVSHAVSLGVTFLKVTLETVVKAFKIWSTLISQVRPCSLWAPRPQTQKMSQKILTDVMSHISKQTEYPALWRPTCPPTVSKRKHSFLTMLFYVATQAVPTFGYTFYFWSNTAYKSFSWLFDASTCDARQFAWTDKIRQTKSHAKF